MSNNQSNMLWKKDRNNVNKIGRIGVEMWGAKILPQSYPPYQHPNRSDIVKKSLITNVYKVIHIPTPLILVTSLYI